VRLDLDHQNDKDFVLRVTGVTNSGGTQTGPGRGTGKMHQYINALAAGGVWLIED
jgi:hypothetical protein